jgi:hypothetical protein
VAAAVGMQSTVLWIKNSPETLGYATNDNIVAAIPENELDTMYNNNLLEEFDIQGIISQCPFPEGHKLFDFDEIINSVKPKTAKNN